MVSTCMQRRSLRRAESSAHLAQRGRAHYDALVLAYRGPMLEEGAAHLMREAISMPVTTRWCSRTEARCSRREQPT